MTGDRKTLPQQMGGLARLPLTTSVSVRAGRLHWTGTLQPTPVSVTYVMKLTYRGGSGTPEVRIVSPQIHAPNSRNLPHVYPGERLCLCYPSEWDAGKMIARTIIPWASEWLLHCEIWTFTGRWHGGGHEPPEEG
jgi:hypothetical protein